MHALCMARVTDEPDEGVLHGGVALGAALELVEEVRDHLRR